MTPEQNSAVTSPYQISAEQSRGIFLNSIAPSLFAEGISTESPTVLVVAGQPGSGKSTAEKALITSRAGAAIVTIDADELRPHHPSYRKLAEANDLTAADLTHHAASDWVDMAIEHGISQRFDALISATLGNSESAAAMIGKFLNAGYRIEIAFVAVDDARSGLGVLSRYHQQRRALGVGRYVPPHIQKRAYTGLPHTAEMIDQERLAESVRVYSRDGRSLYSNSLEDGAWKHPARTRSAIVSERTRPWSRAEITQFLTTATELSKPPPQGLREELRSELSTAIDRSKHNIAGSRARRETPSRFHTTRVFPTAIR